MLNQTNQSQHIKKKVLIIEDEKSIARAMEVKLRKAGLDALAVFDGESGLKELETGTYSLVLLDIMMPTIDGWDVLSKIKQNGIKTRVIITSNLSQDEDKNKAKEMGAVDFLVKSDSTLASIANEVKRLL